MGDACKENKPTNPPKCPDPPPIPKPLPPPTQSDLQEIMRMLEVNKCNSGSGGGVSLVPMAIGGMTLQSGCDALQLMNQVFKSSVKLVSCTLNSVSNCSKTQITSNNAVNITAIRSTIPGVSIKQNTVIKAITATQFTNAITTQINDTIMTQLKTMVTMMQDNKSGFAAKQSDQKQIENIQTEINSSDFKTSLSDSINTIQQSLKSNQSINLTFTDTVLTKPIVIDQETYISLLATSFVSTSFKTFLSNSVVSEFFNSWKASQTADDAGIPFLSMGIMIFVIIIGGLIMFGGGIIKSIMKYVVPIIVISLIIACVYYALTGNMVIAIICGISASLGIVGEIYLTFGNKTKLTGKISGTKMKKMIK